MTDDTIYSITGTVLAHTAHAGDQYILRVLAPEIAALAQPGSFAHLQCNPLLPMRRPLSIMRADATQGWVDFLYKAIGQGTRLLAQKKVDDTIPIIGPIGTTFQPNSQCKYPLLLGGGVGIPPMVFLAERLAKSNLKNNTLVVMGSGVPFPFAARPSQIMVPAMPEAVIAAMPLLEDWGVASRLASLQGYPGCHTGYVTDLARIWLQSLTPEQRSQVEIFACGPHPMLAATAALAQQFQLPCQVSLEEYMACAVGGCAGCTVALEIDDEPAMKRVCVDGPVFDAAQVRW